MTTALANREHQWAAAAWIDVPADQAAMVAARGALTVAPGARVETLDLFCTACRKSYADGADTACEPLDV